MNKSQDKILLKKILTRYDQLGVIRNQLFECKENLTSIEKLRRQSRKKINEINKEFKEHSFKGPLSSLLQRYKLNKYQLIIILTLLRQRLTGDSPYITGREVLRMIFDDSYGILRGMAFLDSSSLLVSAGIIIPELNSNVDEDLLENKFKLSDRVFHMIYNTFGTSPGRELSLSKRQETSYRNNLTFIMDYRKLALLYQKRATKVFNYDYWDEIGLGIAESVEGINRQLDHMRDHIKARLEKTEKTDRLFLLQFIKEYNLSEEETVILITLLFQEVTEGNAYLNAVDLLRLTSQSELDLVRKRSFFSPRQNLVRQKLIQMEEMVNRKELTAEVCLPNWVIERMLSGSEAKSAQIDVDARLDFHNYLQNLDSSEDFLDDLDTL